MLRVVLSTLQVEGASYYNQGVDFEATITSALDYFDITYHQRGPLFLLPDYKLFILQSDEQVAGGSYFSSQEEVPTHELKSTVEKNMIESMLVNVQRKNSVDKVDVEKFNFLLSSGNHLEDLRSPKEGETPQFGQNSDFHFRLSNRSQELKQPKKALEDLIMGESVEE